MIHQKIEKLIPFVNENFITYPLWEEGKYIPFLNCWQRANTKNEYENLVDNLKKCFENTGYEIWFAENISFIHEFCVFPKFKELKNGSYKFEKKDWSIEEMIDLLITILK
jgi:hypothetical protein